MYCIEVSMHILFHAPGQIATILLSTKDSDGYLADAYALPYVNRVFLPDFTTDDGYPQDMTQLDTGLYYFEYTIPSGATAVGTYLIEIVYNSVIDDSYQNELYQIVVTAPFGIYSASIS
jgi:hypothetical protein